jgi:FecR protein
MRYKNTSLTLATLFLLFTLAANAPDIFAADNNTNPDPSPAATAFDEEDADYEETARVVRVSMLSGDVSLRRAGSKNWEKATLNLPLVEGDRLATGADARLEIQIDARNFVRLGQYATLDIVTLRDEGVALSLPEGTATLRLANFDNEREYFEIDAPKTTLAAEQKGSYRLDVAQNGNVRVTVREGGRARLYSETSGFTLRDGRSAELVYSDAAPDGDWELSAARSGDQWDTWVDERERFLASRLRYDGRDRYYDNYVWGAEELDAYGDWVNSSEYGYVWRPHVTVINNYHDWAPYRYGHWRWVSPYGWTWVGDEPWGWAPYHYGRWVYVNNYWGWAPRGYASYRRRSWWRPALVAFVSFGDSYNSNVCWYPLGYHQRDPRSNFYRRAINRAIEQQHRAHPNYQRAVTTMEARQFGRLTARGQPATKELALRAVTAEPERGGLRLRPVEADLRTAGDGRTPVVRERKGDALVIRNPTDPSRVLVERKTGASVRKPGFALDEELRRGRIYNNREPRKIDRIGDANNSSGGGTTTTVNNGERGNGKTTESIGSGDNGERKTGAVARPARPIRIPADGASVEGGTMMKRPVVNNDDGERPERKVRQVERPNTDATPITPEVRRERPTVREERSKPAERERPAPEVYRPRPEVRDERKTQREERPEPRYERPAPVREERSAPREERSAPREERSAPPPQREERRPDPPQREEKRADPPRQRDDSSPIRQKSKPSDND